MTGPGMDGVPPAGPVSAGQEGVSDLVMAQGVADPVAASREAISRGGASCGAASAGQPAPIPAPRIETLRKRADFLRAASARRQGAAGFLVQARRRDPKEADPDLVRVGFTCSRKIGNAVTRNRARRRLRAVARAILPARAQPGWDYVLVGRPGATVTRDFMDLERDLDEALARIHARPGVPR